jgi:hypothetical protein
VFYALGTLVCVLLGSVFSALSIYLRDESFDQGIRVDEDEMACCMKTKHWIWITIFLLLIALAIMVGTLLSDKWVLDVGLT